MKQQPIKLYEAKSTNLPTDQLVRYYGRADGHIYVLYSKSYETPKGQKKVEDRIAQVLNYTFDYKTKRVFKNGKEIKRTLSGQYPDIDSTDIKTKNIDNTRQVQGHYELAEKWFFNNKKLPVLKMKRTK